MKYANKIFGLLAVVLAVFIGFAFAQTPTPLVVSENVTDTTVLTSIALGIAGIVSSVVLVYVRNKFELSSTLTYFLYLIVSAAIAAGVVFYKTGYNNDNLGESIAIIFIVGQAVYQTLIKGTSFAEIGNVGDPPSEVNETTVLKGNKSPEELR